MFDSLTPHGYNISPTGGLIGIGHHSKETIEKIRIGNLGKKRSEETIEKIRISKLNMSNETKEKIGIASSNRSKESNYRCGFANRGKTTWMKGKKHSEYSKKLISQKNLGKKDSKETIKKKSDASSGKNNPMYGRSIYEIWVEKYGKEIADDKYIKWKQNLKKSKIKNG